MRILFIHTDTRFRSEYKVHETLVEYCQNPDLEPCFIVGKGPHISNKNWFCVPMPRTFYDSNAPRLVKWLSTLFFLPGWLYHLMMVARDFKPDVIYSSQHKPDILFAYFVGVFGRIPHVIHLHYPYGTWLGQITQWIIASSKRLITVSEFVRETARLHKVPSEAIHTIVNPLPTPELVFHSGSCARSIRQEHGWTSSTKIIACVGRITETKGQLDLIKAFATLSECHPDARLLFCGDASAEGLDYKIQILQYVVDHKLSTKVAFAGHVNDISAVLDQADIFCLPTVLEAFGLVFLEAMSESLPVVAYHSGAVSEIVVQGVTGLLSYPDDEEALVKNLSAVLSDPAYAQQLGSAGKDRLDSEFSGEMISTRWLNVVQSFV